MANAAEPEIRALIEERLAAIRDKDAHRAMRGIAEDVVAFEMVPPRSEERRVGKECH